MRAAFLIKNSHLTVYSGIGQFARSFVEMSQANDVFVDIITDNKPKVNQRALLDSIKTDNFNCISIESPLSYGKHNQTFVFSESINLELVLNFRNALLEGMKRGVYDLIVINSLEAAYAVYALDVVDKIPTVFYTHNESSIDLKPSTVFSDTYLEFFDKAMRFKNIHIGTQSEENLAILQNKGFKNAICLPLGFTELDLLSPTDTPKDGILFIGRFEDRKNPTLFIDAVKKLNKKALVLTNTRGSKSFREAFSKEGITNYEILENGVGEKKVEFMRKAEIAFHPSKLESYGLCALETLAVCPTVLLEEYNWWKNFKDFGVVTATKDNYVEVISNTIGKEHYVVPLISEFLHKTTSRWKDFIIKEYYKQKVYPKEDQKLNEYLSTHEYISTYDYFFKLLKRDDICVDDVKSLKRKTYHGFYLTDLKEGTLISKGSLSKMKLEPQKESVDWV